MNEPQIHTPPTMAERINHPRADKGSIMHHAAQVGAYVSYLGDGQYAPDRLADVVASIRALADDLEALECAHDVQRALRQARVERARGTADIIPVLEEEIGRP